MRLILILIWFISAPSFAFTQTQNSKKDDKQPASSQEDLPNSIRTDLQKFDREIKRTYLRYIESAENARDKLVSALEKDLDGALKKKDLESANAIKREVEKYRTMDLWLAGRPATNLRQSNPDRAGIPQIREAFQIPAGYWARPDEQYGIIISGNDAKWIAVREQLKVSYQLTWNSEKGEYSFNSNSKGIRATKAGLVLVNYLKKTTHPLHRTNVPKIEFKQ